MSGDYETFLQNIKHQTKPKRRKIASQTTNGKVALNLQTKEMKKSSEWGLVTTEFKEDPQIVRGKTSPNREHLK